MLLFYKQDIHF